MAFLLALSKKIGTWALGFILEFLFRKSKEALTSLWNYFENKRKKREEAEQHKEDKKEKLENLDEAKTEEERKKSHEDILGS